MGWLHAVQSKNKCLNPPCNCVLSNAKAFPNINVYLFDYEPRVYNVTKEFGFFTSHARLGQVKGYLGFSLRKPETKALYCQPIYKST